jgi:hypothetical protein
VSIIKCNKCGTDNPIEALFCQECGYNLDNPCIVKCANCNKEYQLEEDEHPSDFLCDCGGSLRKTLSGYGKSLRKEKTTTETDVFIDETIKRFKGKRISPKEGLIKTANGINGQVELYENKIKIRRRGAGATFFQTWKGDKDILINQISSVQLKKSKATLGYIQFAFLGGSDPNTNLILSFFEENSISFDKSKEKDFIEIKQMIEETMMKLQGINTGGSSKNNLNDLEKLSELRDKGIINEEEFQAKKKQLLDI